MVSSIWFMVVICVMGVATPFVLKILFPHRISTKELLLSIFLSVVVAGIVVVALLYAGKFSTEIHNGYVISKYRETTSCSHSYQVCTGTGNNRVCTTYYEHSHDYNWVVHSSVGDIHIDRIDSQGTKEPPRFTEVRVLEPVAVERHYLDYLKGVDNTLLYTPNVNKIDEFEKLLPDYPTVYDYYRTQPIIFSGVHVSKHVRDTYNREFLEVLKTLGNQRQVNVVVVVVGTYDATFGEYLKNHWRNGRKNDQIIVIGAPEFPKVEWGYSFGWSADQTVNSSIQYDITNLGELTPEGLIWAAHSNIKKSFVRQPMESFKSYLWETHLSWWEVLLAALVQIAANIALAIWFYKKDVL